MEGNKCKTDVTNHMVLRHRSLFRECDSDSDTLCVGIKQGEGYMKREGHDIDTSKQDYQE